MKVRATQVGFYGGARRRAGEIFDVKDGAKAKWFEPVTADAKSEAAKSEPVTPVALSELAKKEAKAAGKKQADDLA